MKYLFPLLIFTILSRTPVFAQTVSLSASDSLEIERIINEPKDGYVFSDGNGYTFAEWDFERAETHIRRYTDSGWFSWPYRMRSGPASPTYSYLLKKKYHIAFEDIRRNCIEEPWFTLYDSLTDIAIVRKYGADFYRNTYAESMLLDKRGMGLMLPSVRQVQNAGSVIKKVLSFLDTVKYGVDRGPSPFGKFLAIEFSGSKIVDVRLGFWAMFFVEAEESVRVKKSILKRLRGLKWKGATFNNELVNTTVLYSFDDNSFTFWSPH